MFQENSYKSKMLKTLEVFQRNLALLELVEQTQVC